MPGPRNQKKKQAKKTKAKARLSVDSQPVPPLPDSPSPRPLPPTPTVSVPLPHESHPQPHTETPPEHAPLPRRIRPSPPPPPPPLAPPHDPEYEAYLRRVAEDAHEPIPPLLTRTPFIQDPGNGPRVKDTKAFLASSFACPPSLDDEMCAEFAQEEVLEMLCSVLPEETAMILWYNKSRKTARICPACQRLYRLGDILPEHLSDRDDRVELHTSSSPYLAKEQAISGLCSPVCFILAAYNYPGAIRSTWGRMAEELDDGTWALLDAGETVQDMGLGMLLKMTRCHDLGLGQLFFPDLCTDPHNDSGEDSEATCHEPEDERVLDDLGLGVAALKVEAP